MADQAHTRHRLRPMPPPDYAVPPGETLRDRLDELEMSQVELARRAGLTTKHINRVVQDQRVRVHRLQPSAPRSAIAPGGLAPAVVSRTGSVTRLRGTPADQAPRRLLMRHPSPASTSSTCQDFGPRPGSEPTTAPAEFTTSYAGISSVTSTVTPAAVRAISRTSCSSCRTGRARLPASTRLRRLATSAAYGGEPSTCLLYTSPSPRDRTRSRM